jgi:predicted Rossmann fold nucleotide-binding protein DprA/Smf involved in DNA uptake
LRLNRRIRLAFCANISAWAWGRRGRRHKGQPSDGRAAARLAATHPQPECQICSRDEAEREIAATRKPGVSYIAIGEASYPHRPQMIDDAPPLVAVRGHTEALAMPLVAVVGSRNAFAAGA